MELSNLDLDLLAKETLELNCSLRHKFAFDFENQDQIENVLSGKFEYPDRPGLIYRIDQNRSTFCLRGIPAISIREKFKEDDLLSGSAFFETPTLEIAQSLFEQIFNRRYPFYDDLMFNLSDPGMSWWMDHDENSFRIYFKSYAVGEGETRPIKLGPIGDPKLAQIVFPHAVHFFRFLFPITEFSCTEKVFSLSTERDSDKTFFNFFKNIFIDGKNEFKLEEFSSLPNLQVIHDYLNELASIRRFWKKIEDTLNLKADENRQ